MDPKDELAALAREAGQTKVVVAGVALGVVLVVGVGIHMAATDRTSPAVAESPPATTRPPPPPSEPAAVTEPETVTEPEPAPATGAEASAAERWLPLRQTRFPLGESEDISGLASVEPGETEKGWGIYQLVDPVRRKLPLHARWELIGVQVDRYSEPTDFARGRGIVGDPGFFASFGVRSEPPTLDAFHLEDTPGASLSVALYFCPDARVTGFVGVFVPGAPGDMKRDLRIGDKVDFKGYDLGIPVVVDLDAQADRWALAVTQGDRRLVSISEPWSKRPAVGQALASSAHVWADVGCFDTGLGRATVGTELLPAR